MNKNNYNQLIVNILTLVFSIFLLVNCTQPADNLSPKNLTFREEMRFLVRNISEFSKNKSKTFGVIVQNGLELLENDNKSYDLYIAAVDAVAVESLNYGYDGVDQPTNDIEKQYFAKKLAPNHLKSKPVFAIDYCTYPSLINDSFNKNSLKNYKIFNASSKQLDGFPSVNTPIFNENKNDITQINDAKNFMVLLDISGYTSEQLLENMAKTNYDLVVIDAFANNKLLTLADIKALKIKKNGAKRLVLAHLNISEIDSQKYNWNPAWTVTQPSFITKESQTKTGIFKTKYWDTSWQNLIISQENSLLNNFIKMDFDGVYITNINAYEWFE